MMKKLAQHTIPQHMTSTRSASDITLQQSWRLYWKKKEEEDEARAKINTIYHTAVLVEQQSSQNPKIN